MKSILVTDLGRRPYGEVLALQRDLCRRLREGGILFLYNTPRWQGLRRLTDRGRDVFP